MTVYFGHAWMPHEQRHSGPRPIHYPDGMSPCSLIIYAPHFKEIFMKIININLEYQITYAKLLNYNMLLVLNRFKFNYEI